MTGIAWDGTLLSADSMADTSGNKQHYQKVRIITLPEIQPERIAKLGEHLPSGKCLFAACGNVRATEEMIQLLESGCVPDREKPFSGLVSTATYGILVDCYKKAYDIYGDGTLGPAMHVSDRFWSNGSAWEFLLGAMAAGCTAQQAVELAVEYRSDCGYDVQTLNWNEVFDERFDGGIPF